MCYKKICGMCFIILTLCITPLLLKGQPVNKNQNIDPLYFKGLEYRLIGPFRGGRVTAVEGIPSNPSNYYMGSTGGGVWKTTDSGKNWTNITDGYLKVGSIGAVTVAPSDTSVVYIGSGSACPRGNVSLGDGVYKSMDAGKSWNHIGLSDAGLIGKVIVDPRNPDQVYVAALGNIFKPNEQRGVFRSKDGGESWEKVLFVSDSTGAVDLAINPDNPQVMYAAMWRAERKPWTMIDGGKEGGVWKSTDGGDSWERLTNGLPSGKLGRIGVTVSPANPDRVWVLLESNVKKKGGLYRSDDAGKTFKQINKSQKLRQRSYYYMHVHADPIDPNTVYIENVNFFKSTNGGQGFKEIDTPHGDNHDLWINPNNNNILVQGNDGGANVSKNGGKSWSTQLNQPTAEFYRATVDNQFPYRVYGGQQDNSTISIPSKMPGDINPKQYWYSVGGGESAHIAVNPDNPNIVFAGNYSSNITNFNKETGRILKVTPYAAWGEGTKMIDMKYRFQWNAPIRISSYNPDIIYHTAQFVLRSSNGGITWKKISPNLTNHNPEYLDRIPGGPIQHDATGVENYSTIFAFEESSQKEGELWAGSDDGLLHVSRDSGRSWDNITPENIPDGGTINMIDLSKQKHGRAYIAVYKYREGDFKPYIFRTENFGEDWKLLTNGNNGIPSDHFVRVIREDPLNENVLYSGTEYGMYISFDRGEHWQPFQQNLPVSPITDLQVHNDDLVVATQGRSFWILDDLSPLRQLNVKNNKHEVHLFKPSDAYRTQLRGYVRGNYAPDSYPTGALIDFYLSDQAVNKTIELDILNSKNQVIRSFSTDYKKKGVHKLEVDKGLNRFEWDLNYGDAPFTLEDFVMEDNANLNIGSEAVPGKYQAKLRVGEVTQSQNFIVKLDPRWEDVSVEGLRQTHELTREIAEMISRTQHAIQTLRSIHHQVNNSNFGEKGSKDVLKNAERLGSKAKELENELINNKIKSGQDPIVMERVFSNWLGRLYLFVQGHDDKPTAGMKERFADLRPIYNKYMDQFNKIIERDLKSFNNLLEKEKISPILPKKK